jgi:hypothetical protein
MNSSENDMNGSASPRHDTDYDYLLGLLAGLACGLALGGAMGLLLAPAAGSDTRARILEQGRAARRRTAEWFDRQTAIEIVRRRGVRGLIEVLQHEPRPPADAGGNAAPRADHGTADAV